MMKKLWWALAFVIVATAAKDVFQHFGLMAEAYRAYLEQAEAVARAKRGDSRYRHIEGHITSVDYRLESAEPAGDQRVRLVVVESLTFQKASEMGPMGDRRVAATRQRVVMFRDAAGWILSELVEDEPVLTELSSFGLEASP